MSLFGTSPEESAASAAIAKSRLSLFEDEPSPAAGSQSSLFTDDDLPGSSPWGMPTPKKTSRAELIKSLLPSSAVPDSYVDIFDHVNAGDDGTVGKISPSGVSRVLSAANLGADEQTKIMNLIAPGGLSTNLGRNEFNVLLALVGLAQEREDITLDSVDERRRHLPIPKLPSLTGTPKQLPGTAELTSKPAQRPKTPPETKPVPAPRAGNMRRQSMNDEDPWSSPALHKNHNHITPKTNGAAPQEANGTRSPIRTSSTFTTDPVDSGIQNTNQTSESRPSVGSLWESYDGGPMGSFQNPAASGVESNIFGDGPGGDDEGQQPPSSQSRALGGRGFTSSGPDENILVTLMPEKEGVFMFQHHNYQVSSIRRNSKVIRRYSDFVWLLDCLHKRYPFRQLPLLPPKRVGVNGSHLAADSTFIEKRRRGLSRFCNALVRHPILGQEQLVIMFLTVPTHQELAVWRKQATISVQEEFAGKTLPPGLEDSLSPTLNDLFEMSRAGIRKSAEIYINLCTLVDRLAKRNEGLAADQGRIASCLMSLTNESHSTYATDDNDVPLLNEGLQTTANHLSNSRSLLEDEARAWDEGLLEDVKRQRDSLVSMREVFDRKDRYDKDNIPYLEKRIQKNENKLVELRAKPDGLVKPGEMEKVTEAIIKDKESIVAQHARSVFVKECIRDELVFFQQSQYHVNRWNQDWAQERVKYSELQADNWKQLHDQLESMPIGE